MDTGGISENTNGAAGLNILEKKRMLSVPLIEIVFVHPSLASSAPEWFVLPILWKTHGMGVNHRVFSKESL